MSFLDLTEEMPPHPQMRVGRYTYGLKRESSDVTMSCNWRLEIGSFCSIAPGVRFVFGRHQMNCPTTFPIREFVRHEWKPELWPEETIVVGHDVWIATNALILSGVSVGHGAIICAGAVVTRDVAPYAIVGGVPAKHIRARMESEKVEKMLSIAWWNWPEEKILSNEKLLYGDVESFIRTHWTATDGLEQPNCPRPTSTIVEQRFPPENV